LFNFILCLILYLILFYIFIFYFILYLIYFILYFIFISDLIYAMYRMLSMMGWKGKGLGANEDGITDYIRVKKRADNKGFSLIQY
jgi:G-patch domain